MSQISGTHIIKKAGPFWAITATLVWSGCVKNSATNTALDQTVSSAQQISESSYRETVKVLSSDRFGGRAPGTKGGQLTVEYLEKAFQAQGLKPAANNSYSQKVSLVSTEVTNKPSLALTSSSGQSLTLSYGKEQVLWSRGQQNTSGIANSQLVFVGYGINAPERDWNDYKGIDVKGKTVVILVNDPGFGSQDPALFNGNSMTYYGRWTYKFEEAARQGAAGALIVHQTKPAAYPWSTVEASWTGKQYDVVRSKSAGYVASVEGWISEDSTKRLFDLAGQDFAKLAKSALKPEFKAVDLNLRASATINNNLDQVESHNVAGLIPGSEKPDEVFIYMAHWDHIGTNHNLKGDNIYNGALDNATGTAGLIELAKAFGSLQIKPKRSVMFLAVTAEEQGLLGSAHYAANPLIPLAKTVGGLNMDGLNIIGRTRDITVVGKGMSQLETILEKHAKAQNRVLVADPEPEKGYFFRSDHFELAKRGVPMLYADAGKNHLEKGVAYGQKMADDYVANRYHQPSDEFDPNWDLSGAVDDLRLFFQTGYDVANSSSWPEWNEGSEFKAARDQYRK